jgi:hypothetical protein
MRPGTDCQHSIGSKEKPVPVRGRASKRLLRDRKMDAKRLTLIRVVLAAALGAVDPAQRSAVAQTPEEMPRPQETQTPLPESLKDFLKQQWTRPTPPLNEPAPDTANDTINVMRRARGRASGTPEAEPTPKW